MITPVRISHLFRFWAPLQATWLMMSLEGPFLAAVIARLPDPKFNLAAYGVAFALAILVEAPVIMMMSAATALVDGRQNYLGLRRFAWALNLGITLAMIGLIFTPAWNLLTHDLMRLDSQVADLAHTALVLLLPWPAAIGLRRFCQGLLIRAGLTRLVAWGTVVRLITMAGVALGLKLGTGWAGAHIGAAALSAGVITEAVAARWMAVGTVRELLGRPSDGVLSQREIGRFYLPLALTSTIALAVQPLATFFMGMGRYPLESLALLPVINSLVFIFRTPGLSYQETAITMLGRSPINRRPVLSFATLLGAAAAIGLLLIVWTPLAAVWLQRISGLDASLAEFAIRPLRILGLMPALSVLLSLQRSLLVHRRQTEPITWASLVEVGGISIVLVLTVTWGGWVGATAAATAFMAGRAAACGWLVWKSRD